MAKFAAELPTELLRDIESIYGNTDKILGAMVKAGAKVAKKNIVANLPEGIQSSAGMMSCLKTTKVYETPSDDGINCKVGFFGYFENENGQIVPAPLVANVFEYGRSNAPFPKQPFLRKSFNKAEIEQAMLAAQKKASGGLLE